MNFSASTLLGIYFTLEEYRKNVVPGQRVYLWVPPDFERVEGVAGEGWGSGEPICLVRLGNGSLVQVTEDNVFLFQPGSPPKKSKPLKAIE